MTSVLIIALAIALVAAVLALCREMRLRKALERLLNLVLTRWRTHVSKTQANDLDPMGHADERDEWL
jgi:hypothetical protein